LIRQEYDFDTQVALTQEVHRLVAQDQPYTFLYEPTEPIALDRRIVEVQRKPDGSESFRKVQLTPTGELDYYFRDWRKLSQEPALAP